MKREAEFAKYLKVRRRYSLRSASDARSRCKRIEKVFHVSLDTLSSSDGEYEGLLGRITSEVHKISKGSTSAQYAARGAHRLAVKLYYEFLNA